VKVDTFWERPGVLIYTRKDGNRAWRTCESEYELGYCAGMADSKASVPAMTLVEHYQIFVNPYDYREGYDDGYGDYETMKGDM